MAYPFRDLSEAEVQAFLDEPRHAILATRRREGAPQVSPIWYLLEDGALYFSVMASSAKAKNLLRDPRVSLCVDAGHPDARSVIVYGTAERIAYDPALERRIAARYDGSAAATAADPAPTGVMLFRVPLTRVISRDYNS